MKIKKVSIILLSLAVLFIISQAFVMKSSSDTEMYPYEVIESYEDFEIRRYEAANFSYVKLDTDGYRESSGLGFRKLAGYIFGNNADNQKIAMTSPVTMNFSDSTTMLFMIPSEYELEDLPQPNDAQVKFKREPEKIMAAIRFGGWADDERIEIYTKKLKKALKREGIKHTGDFSFLGYNPPYEVVNRRNEVVVEVTL